MMRADDIIDRQRLRKKVTFWRITSLIIVLIAVFAIMSALGGFDKIGAFSSDHVAKVRIEGTIIEDEDLLDQIEEITENDRVKGVILSIDSPGGTTAGGEAIYEAVRVLAEKKPVVAQVGTLAASAGYMIASAADQIVARKTSIVGSIGVIFQYPNIEELLTKLGIDMRAIKSTPMKAEPSFFGETPPEAEAMISSMILDSFDWFKEIVTERRGFSVEQTAKLADGSVFTGRQAKENGLIDQLGGEEVARAWLVEKGIDEGLKTLEWKRPSDATGFMLSKSLTQWFLYQIGLGRVDNGLDDTLHRRLMLDGLLSVWHAPS